MSCCQASTLRQNSRRPQGKGTNPAALVARARLPTMAASESDLEKLKALERTKAAEAGAAAAEARAKEAQLAAESDSDSAEKKKKKKKAKKSKKRKGDDVFGRIRKIEKQARECQAQLDADREAQEDKDRAHEKARELKRIKEDEDWEAEFAAALRDRSAKRLKKLADAEAAVQNSGEFH